MSNQGTPPRPPNAPRTLASRGIQPRFSELGQSCRKLVLNRLAASLTRAFAQVDDTLFECAEKAENNQVQTLFLDNMRSIRKLRPQIERHYHQAISQTFSDFLDGKLEPHPALPELDAEQLTLVQNEDYEETLQVTNMVSQVKDRCAQALFALDQRLALLNNGKPLDEDSNPFGPRMIAQAFRHALAPCPLPLRIKTVLYMLFDRHVMYDLDAVYATLNQRLVEAGVLPELKYTAARNATPARAATRSDSAAAETARRQPTAAAPTGHAPRDLDAPPPADLAQWLDSLNALLEAYRRQQPSPFLLGGTPSMASFGPASAKRTYSASALLEALDRMQRQSAEELAQRMQKPQQVARLKADLHQQLTELCDEPQPHKLEAGATDVVDLVGMLFDFILNDDDLPDSCKTALSHLHTPYLKIALQDKALFTQPQHPARKLLNAMAQVGALYGDEGEEHGLLAKMHGVVERVIRDFAGDLQLFEALLTEFNAFAHTVQQKVELRERRAVDAAKGRDKLLAARQSAARVIAHSLDKHLPPALIRHFLEQTWIDVLAFIQLRHGDASDEWQRASDVAERLAWSGTLLDAEQHAHLQRLRAGMLEELRKGLLLLGGYHDDGIRRLLQDLVACQDAVQARQPLASAELDPPPSPLGSMPGKDTVLAPQNGSLTPHAQLLAKELGRIEFGTWFEFSADGQTRTLKLSWYSTTTLNYLFVDHGGQRATIKPLVQLAREMEQGLVRILPPDRAAPLVDRAFAAIYRVLQRFTSRRT